MEFEMNSRSEREAVTGPTMAAATGYLSMDDGVETERGHRHVMEAPESSDGCDRTNVASVNNAAAATASPAGSREEDGDRNNSDNNTATSETNVGMPPHSSSTNPPAVQHSRTVAVEATLRWLMTGTAALLVSAAVLSLLVTTQFHFLILCIWMLIGALFAGFCLVIRDTIMQQHRRDQKRQRRGQIFHPAVHAAADWLVAGVTDFVDDCRDEYQRVVLLLKDPSTHDDDGDAPNGGENLSRSKTNRDQNDATSAQQDAPRPPRTRLFRVMVQPLFHLAGGLRRRQGRRRNQKSSSTSTPETPDDTNATMSYEPLDEKVTTTNMS